MERQRGQLDILPTEAITNENLPAILQKVNEIVETPRTSEILIPYLDKSIHEADLIGENSRAIELMQVKFISAEHMVNEERTNIFQKNDNERSRKGFMLMEESVLEMEDYRDSHLHKINEDLVNMVPRYKGRYADKTGDYELSEKYYKEGLIYFEGAADMKTRHIKLEFEGLLSYPLLKQGKFEEGMQLAERAITEFKESDEGKWLKEVDYYRYGVWFSGIAIRTAEAVLLTYKGKGWREARKMISEANYVLSSPDYEDRFKIRKRQLNLIRIPFLV